MSTASTVQTGESRASRLRFVVILGVLTALGPLSIDTYLPALPSLSRDLTASASAVQLSITACLVGLGVGQLVAGPLSDAFGRRRPLLLGLGLYAVTSVLCALAPSVWVLVALRLLQGVGGATGIVISLAIVRDRDSGADAAKFLSLLLLITGIAPVLAPVAGGQILRFTSWEGIFAALAIVCAVMIAAVAFGLPETLPRERRQPGGARRILPVFGRLLSDRAFVGYVLSSGLAFAAMFAYIAGSPFVLQEIYGLSPQVYSAVFAVNALGLVIAAQLTGRLVHRIGARRLLAVGVAGSAIGGLVTLVDVLGGLGLPCLLAGLFVVVASVGVVMPTSAALAMSDHGEVAGAAAALIGLAQFFTGALVAPLVGVAGAGDARPMAVVIAVLGASAFAACALLTRATGRDQEATLPAEQASVQP